MEERIEVRLICAIQITVQAINDLSKLLSTFCREPAMLLYCVHALKSVLVFVT